MKRLKGPYYLLISSALIKRISISFNQFLNVVSDNIFLKKMGKISDYNTIEKHLLSKKGSYKDFPFGPGAVVYKVCNKMFAIMNQDNGPLSLNLKCDPDDAEVLRSIFSAVMPGYHMNKRHWNSVYLDGSIPEGAVCQMIDDSYKLVVKGLKKSEREKLLD